MCIRDRLNAENIEKYQQAQGQITQALGKLMVLTENYPELKATQQFSDLSAQLEGTENRITVAVSYPHLDVYKRQK